MQKIIEQYFIEFGQVDLLTVGQLKLQQQDAIFESELIKKPQEHILFEPINAMPSKHFYLYLAKSLDLTYEKAVTDFEIFIQDNFYNNSVSFNSPILGRFEKEDTQFNWYANYNSTSYYTDLHFEKLTSSSDTSVSSNDIVKDDWWIYVIIIFLMSFTAIVFKLYMK